MAIVDIQGGDRVIAGIDGSEPSKLALRWAARQAELTNSLLEVMAVWQLPVYGWAYSLPPELDFAEMTRTMLVGVVDEVLGSEGEAKPIVTLKEGHPNAVLLEASQRAELMVVGCRGLGALRGALIGSVSTYLASHAHCPIVVVHDGDHRHS